MSLKKILENCYSDICFFDNNSFDINNKIEKLTNNDCTKLRLMLDQVVNFRRQKRHEVISEFEKKYCLEDGDLKYILKKDKENYRYIDDYKEHFLIIDDKIDTFDLEKEGSFEYLPDFASYFLWESKSNRNFSGLNIIFNLILDKIKAIENKKNKIVLKGEGNKIENNKLNTLENNLHSQIFKGNAFEVWKFMFQEFDIKESSRTDIKFMYEIMKKDGLINSTVNQKNILGWVNDTYEMTVEKTSNYNKSDTRMKAFGRAKTLYKPKGYNTGPKRYNP